MSTVVAYPATARDEPDMPRTESAVAPVSSVHMTRPNNNRLKARLSAYVVVVILFILKIFLPFHSIGII
jgi:hypothetical protein